MTKAFFDSRLTAATTFPCASARWAKLAHTAKSGCGTSGAAAGGGWPRNRLVAPSWKASTLCSRTGRRSTMASLAGAALASCSILLLLLVSCAQGQGQPPEAPEEAWPEGQPPEAPEEAWPEGQPPEAPEDALTMLLSKGGCGAFAGLVAATAGVGDAFREQIGSDLGLTILCPDDEAVGTFIPRFHGLTVDEQVAALLYHGLTMAYSEELLSWVHREVLTLDGEQMLTVRHHRGRVILSSWPQSTRNKARITKTVVDDDHLAVYLIDAVLIPADLKRRRVVALIVIIILVLVVGGLVALFLRFHALVYLGSLVCRLTRWCKGRAAAYASAARVTPHGQGQQEH
ncbi:unnamed protein product [Triticum aestivum]|uniref:FAS1 domain-containing protein n=1 Tax=Triticum aestivum TaxID=4565 RepID=A0A7H4LEM9_WHEAT|nr:uncharacterized protein LOC123049033 [Triticum aestivum]SPT17067.1 unnamed protein product [Triticum aestivum]